MTWRNRSSGRNCATGDLPRIGGLGTDVARRIGLAGSVRPATACDSPGSAGPPGSASDEVHQDVLSEPFRGREEGPAAI